MLYNSINVINKIVKQRNWFKKETQFYNINFSPYEVKN